MLRDRDLGRCACLPPSPGKPSRLEGLFVVGVILVLSCGVQRKNGPQDLLGVPIDLAAARTPEVHYYRMETRYVHIGFDGKRTGSETYTFTLRGVPAAVSGKRADEYTCGEFRLQVNDGPVVTIPSLSDWSYFVQSSGMDAKGQVLGVPHEKFKDLSDSNGKPLSGTAYIVYNNFIDFHAFNDVFARPSAQGRGIQDLRTLGQKVVHASAFSKPPIDLGSTTKPGSYFENGEVTLELKGVSDVDGRACAVVGYDSGESNLKVITPFGQEADKEVVTLGGSEYKGDIYVDLETRWVPKITMDEFVVTHSEIPDGIPAIDAYTVRHIIVRTISKDGFERHD